MKTIYEYEVNGIRVWRVRRDGQSFAMNYKAVQKDMKNLVITARY